MSVPDEVIEFIRRPDTESFDRLALKIFRYQYERVPEYRQYCQQLDVKPEAVTSITQIPAVSTIAFKYSVFADGAPERIFVTSGTTKGAERRGHHYVTRLEIYRLSAISHLRRMLFPDRMKMPILALHPTAETAPQSSLSQMLTFCIEEFASESLVAARPSGLDLAAAVAYLEKAERAALPVCILTTTAALAVLLDELKRRNRRLALPSGSRIMDTGGVKGLSRPELIHQIPHEAWEYLRVPHDFLVNEYGMTELCSQLYDATPLNFPNLSSSGERFKVPPPWLRVDAVDPATFAPLPEGEIGLLKFFDLANVGSVSALLTEDLGAVESRGVRLVGRAEGSEPRGCALGLAPFAETERDPVP